MQARSGGDEANSAVERSGVRDAAGGVEGQAERPGSATGTGGVFGASGYGRIALSALFEVGVDTISAWLDGWERAGLRGCMMNPVRDGRRSTRRMKPPASADGWMKNPAPRECPGIPQSHEPEPVSHPHRPRHLRLGRLRRPNRPNRPNRPSRQAAPRRPRQRPLHTSRAVQARVMDWFRQGVALHWLPPYSPELNLIEIRWHKIKYEWFPLRAYLSFDHLQSELQNILDQVGSKYKITFG